MNLPGMKFERGASPSDLNHPPGRNTGMESFLARSIAASGGDQGFETVNLVLDAQFFPLELLKLKIIRHWRLMHTLDVIIELPVLLTQKRQMTFDIHLVPLVFQTPPIDIQLEATIPPLPCTVKRFIHQSVSFFIFLPRYMCQF